MASYTTNLNLKKPAGSENVAIGDINNNMDAIDNAYGNITNVSDVTSQITENNCSHSSSSKMYKQGRIATLDLLTITPSEDKPAWSSGVCFTLPTGLKPLANVYIPFINDTGYLQVTTSGTIIPSKALTSGTTYYISSATWICSLS